MSTINADSNQYKFLNGIVAQYTAQESESDPNRKQSIGADIQKAVSDYIQGNVVEVKKDANGYTSIAVPYAYLTPLNVIFNRSLQNLSSYYTDIGFIWIVSLILLLAGTIYAMVKQERTLIILHLVTLCGWIIRWFIASGIIWYAVGIIAWTLFCNAIYVSRIIANNGSNILIWSGRIILATILLTAGIQTTLNMFRIASQ